MAKIIGDYVEKFGSNVILLGDLNTGFSSSGDKESAYKKLLSSASSIELRNAYEQRHSSSMTDKHSFISDHADRPHERTGRMIDHILVAQSYKIHRSNVDRHLFSGNTRVKCDDDHSDHSIKYRTSCVHNGSYTSIFYLSSYSDHWGVWADLERTACVDGC